MSTATSARGPVTSSLPSYEPVLLTVVDDRVWLEVHPDPYRRVPSIAGRVETLARAVDGGPSIDWSRVTAVVGSAAGIAIDVTGAEP